MEIPFENLHNEQEPYELFIQSIKSEETKRKYKSHLEKFLKLIPNKIFDENIGKHPKDRKLSTLASHFVELAKKDAKFAYNVILAYIKEEKKLVESGELNPNTLPNHIKPIKALLDSNAVAIHWKSLYRLYPRPKKTEDRAYTREELQKMIEVASDVTDKLIIQLFSSGGFRVEAWDYFTWKDLIFFKNEDGTFKGASLLVYRGDPESYWTFITPEACRTLQHYMELWKSQVGREPFPNDPLIKSEKYPVVRRLNSRGIKKRISKMVGKIGLRPPLKQGQKRHEVPLDHGFRKYFNTMMRRAKVNYLDKEDMMGHSVGLEKHYERYQEEDFERFPEYQKAIPFLTITDEERQKFIISEQKSKISELEKKNEEIKKLKSSETKNAEKVQELQETVKSLQESMKSQEDHILDVLDGFYKKKIKELESKKRRK